MAENLWEIRRRKKMKVRDLAAKSGVPVPLVHQYEAGEKPISQAHLRQFARALIVDTWDIKPMSDPKPRDLPPGPAGGGRPPREPRPPKAPRPPRPPLPVRPSQIEHMLRLAARFTDVTRASLEAQAGKLLEALTQKEASQLLGQLQQRIRVEQPGRPAAPFDRHRAHLPEGVDGFEMHYLTAAQEAGQTLSITLFDGSRVEGQIVGFSPYTITLRQPDGAEITVNKLAIATYRKG
jgi:transcriptional regulator with XRE-family HTH domain/sRNA-binding regulator protein Hfq